MGRNAPRIVGGVSCKVGHITTYMAVFGSLFETHTAYEDEELSIVLQCELA